MVLTRPQRTLLPAVMVTSIMNDMKAIKIRRINFGHPHLDRAAADEYGVVMNLQGCRDCRGYNKAEGLL